jgi:hypothetical protein
MEKETYNGWTNYATWRIKLELWDDDRVWDDYMSNDIEPFESVYALSEHIKEYTENFLEDSGELAPNNKTNVVLSYALAFISDVNWYEIAQHIADDYPKLIKK